MEFTRLSLVSQLDCFQAEVEQFNRDIHSLILGTLDAAMKFLSGELQQEVAKLQADIAHTADGSRDYLRERIDYCRWHYSQQEKFVRNMAVVSLASRLTHALQQMAKFAEPFNPRKKNYGDRSNSEFQRLWIEYTDRFGFDLVSNADMIAFVEPMRAVRNQIVHDAGKANPFKAVGDSELSAAWDDMLDLSFSEQYPEFVEGEGWNAEVRVTKRQLDSMIKDAIALVRWCAQELRQLELAHAVRDDEDNPGRVPLEFYDPEAPLATE